MRAGLYARVSTNLQETENQLIELKRYCQRMQWDFDAFVDRGYSGALTQDERPGLKSLLEAARMRKIDAVITWELSRLARSVRQLIDIGEDLRTWNVQLIVLKGGFDTTSAQGRMMFGMLAVIAEFERELIRERVNLGLARARQEGKILGRPKLDVDPETVKLWIMGCRKKPSIRDVAAQFGVSKTWMHKALSLNPTPKTGGRPIETAPKK